MKAGKRKMQFILTVVNIGEDEEENSDTSCSDEDFIAYVPIWSPELWPESE